MWNTAVSIASGLVGRLMLGFVDACSAHPVLVVGFFGLLLGLVLALWAEMLQLRPSPPRGSGRRTTEGAVRTRPRTATARPLRIRSGPSCATGRIVAPPASPANRG